ncbi:hypothetical protein GGQ68_002654 [Sagittula marina]|uniref:Uncharacterized protein n=1 Tax=Sagittula marina TaxID=943940 RepID=A0A7W6GSS3_9RHOB|nr:hypothetical protein [Sagittula marina]MBB3986315.1 hypothetical protein [Sagittula marina]
MKSLLLALGLFCAAPAIAQEQLPPQGAARIDAVNQATNTFLMNRQRGAHDLNWTTLVPDLQSQQPRTMFRNVETAHAEQTGKLIGFQVTDATLYPNEDAVALAYLARYEHGLMECGTFLWEALGNEAPRLRSLSATAFTAEQATTEDGAKALTEAGCKLPPR